MFYDKKTASDNNTATNNNVCQWSLRLGMDLTYLFFTCVSVLV